MCCLFYIVCPLLWACRVSTETTSSFSTVVPTPHRKKLMNYGNFDQTTSPSSVIVSHLSLAICWADREIYTNATQMQTKVIRWAPAGQGDGENCCAQEVRLACPAKINSFRLYKWQLTRKLARQLLSNGLHSTAGTGRGIRLFTACITTLRSSHMKICSQSSKWL